MPFSYERARKELLEEQAKLSAQLKRLESVEYESIGCSNHMADDATDAFDQAVDVALRHKVVALLEDVGRALGKLEDGTYGICEVCKTAISKTRLKALPQASFCVKCQEKREKK